MRQYQITSMARLMMLLFGMGFLSSSEVNALYNSGTPLNASSNSGNYTLALAWLPIMNFNKMQILKREVII